MALAVGNPGRGILLVGCRRENGSNSEVWKKTLVKESAGDAAHDRTQAQTVAADRRPADFVLIAHRVQ